MSLIETYKNKSVLVTGHTGFKGSWLALWLESLGAHVTGASLTVPTSPSHYEEAGIKNRLDDRRLDIRDGDAVRNLMLEVQPDFVFHMAAQALVRPSYDNPVETIEINGIGTANVLDSLRLIEKPVTAILITSDKAYDNLEWVWGYRETDRLGGKDPYSASKGIAELVIRSFVESYFKGVGNNVRIGIARAGNVIGGGDWALDRIVPDCMNAWSEQKLVDIRSPFATRPWQHVLEPLSGYLSLGAAMQSNYNLHGEAYNFGPHASQNFPVCDLINEMSKYWDNVRWNDISREHEHVHEAGLLKLNCDKALFDLNWEPTLEFQETVRMTVEWYKTFYNKPNHCIYEYTRSQIDEYSQFARQRGRSWAK